VPNLGLGELVVILMLVVLVFGATRLPQLGEGIGKAVANFKRTLGSGEGGGNTPGEKNGEG
jgi:sec-independent protein translocase protein TatA